MIIEIKKEEDQRIHIYAGLGDLDENMLTRVYRDPRGYTEIAVNDCRHTVKNLENENDKLALFCKYEGDEYAFQMYCADYVIADRDCCKHIGFYENSEFELTEVNDKVVIYEKGTEKKFPLLNRLLNPTDVPKTKKKTKEKKE